MNSAPSTSEHLPVGCVNGRFQPPHNGHREYILAAKERCDFLWLGITHYDLLKKNECEIAPHRADPASNPLTYYERIILLTKMLLAEGIPQASFGFVPFPIDEDSHLTQFMPTTVVCFTTIYEEWNKRKIKVLEDLGYKVNVLWDRSGKEKQFSGGKIRASIRAGKTDWEASVPAALLPDIRDAHIERR
jgi:cytidyltransferase-like protein